MVNKGHTVWFIHNNEIIRGSLVSSDGNKAIVTSNSINFQTVLKYFGEDLFLKRKQAQKALVKRKKQTQKSLDKLADLTQEQKVTKPPKNVENQITKSVCYSCGLPIGNFGHCGCSR